VPGGARRRLRLLAGGAIGGAVVLAEHRRRRLPLPGGVRAFEDAPCFRADHAGARDAPALPDDGDPGR
jgi:hypothetical protein